MRNRRAGAALLRGVTSSSTTRGSAAGAGHAFKTAVELPDSAITPRYAAKCVSGCDGSAGVEAPGCRRFCVGPMQRLRAQ